MWHSTTSGATHCCTGEGVIKGLCGVYEGGNATLPLKVIGEAIIKKQRAERSVQSAKLNVPNTGVCYSMCECACVYICICMKRLGI